MYCQQLRSQVTTNNKHKDFLKRNLSQYITQDHKDHSAIYAIYPPRSSQSLYDPNDPSMPQAPSQYTCYIKDKSSFSHLFKISLAWALGLTSSTNKLPFNFDSNNIAFLFFAPTTIQSSMCTNPHLSTSVLSQKSLKKKGR